MPRKTHEVRDHLFHGLAASMRPRPDAAENDHLQFLPVRQHEASMRPRPDAAENLPDAEDDERGADPASMRPRPDAAENSRSLRSSSTARTCFNEAAARCRGKPASIPATKR